MCKIINKYEQSSGQNLLSSPMALFSILMALDNVGKIEILLSKKKSMNRIPLFLKLTKSIELMFGLIFLISYIRKPIDY